MGHLKALNDSELVQNEHERPPQSFRINLVSFRASRGPLFPKPVSWLGQAIFAPWTLPGQPFSVDPEYEYDYYEE